ncbi:MAG: hypothetical protein ABIL09_15190 [Gemmatimonadota bacterium]
MDPAQPRLEAVSDLALIAGALPARTVIIPGGDRPEDLRLVESARDHGIVERCLLVGDGDSIRRAAATVGVAVDEAISSLPPARRRRPAAPASWCARAAWT